MKECLDKLSEIFNAINILADRSLKSEQEAIEQLVKSGFSIIDAERLIIFIPLAFGRVLLERMEITNFTDELIINTADEKEIKLFAHQEHYFISALAIAEDNFRTGKIRREFYEEILTLSVEFQAVNNALNEGCSISKISEAKFLPTKWNSTLPEKIWRQFLEERNNKNNNQKKTWWKRII